MKPNPVLSALALIMLMLLAAPAGAQHVTFANSQEILKKGSEATAAENYKEAISLFGQVQPGDTNYAVAGYEVAYCYYLLDDHDKVISQCETLFRNGVKDVKMYNIMGWAYDQKKDYKQSIRLYDEALTLYPYSETLRYNRALSFERQGDRRAAVSQMEALLQSSPRYPAAHARMGYYAETEGRLTQAIMAYTMYLVINPDGKSAHTVLESLNKLCDNSSTNANTAKEKVLDNEFEELDFLVGNQVALNEKFKVPGKKKFPINKQVYLVMQKTAAMNDNGNGFYSTFYLPFFRDFLKKSSYEGFSMLLLASSQNETLQVEMKKEIPNMIKARTAALDQFNAMHPGMLVDAAGKKEQLEFWFNNDANTVSAFGNVDATRAKRQGRWIFIEADGNMSAIGEYDNTGERTGKWYFFEPGGDTTKMITYRGGKFNGAYELYSSKKLSERGEYRDGLLEGQVMYYFYDGTVRAKAEVKGGLDNGITEMYYANGQLKSSINYVNGVPDGAYKEFYYHGARSEEGTMRQGKRNGNYKAYYENGNLRYDYNYVNGAFDGTYKVYYSNGTLKEEGRAAQGKQVGKWIENYSDSGRKEVSYLDENGKNNGNLEYYDHKGRLYRTDTYERGDWASAVYRDASGKVTYEWKRPKKPGPVAIFDEHLDKYGEGTWQNNKRQGDWTFYYANGQVARTETYNDGAVEGRAESKYLNGNIKRDGHYKAGDEEGLQLAYYSNSKLAEEGNSVAGSRYGNWKEYSVEGNLVRDRHYWENNRAGWEYEYLPNGNVYRRQRFDNGKITGIWICDSNGVAIDSVDLIKGYGKASLKGMSGKKYQDCAYIDGHLHGAYTMYYPDQKPFIKRDFYMGYSNGDYTAYGPLGKLQVKGNYFHGDQAGTWDYYNCMGELESRSDYKFAQNTGYNTWYYPSGKIKSKIPVYEDEKNGVGMYYAPDGQLRLLLYFDHGKITGYSYHNAGNKPVDTIVLAKGEGVVKALYPNGKVSIEFELKGGEYHGAYKMYYPDGRLHEERTYVYGDETGATKIYYENGALCQVTNYEAGKQSGDETWYTLQGTVRAREHYANGRLQGWSDYYEALGKPARSIYYVSGEPFYSK